jgi:anti-sigma regulatory factor (Ser/Thr protein kinase)
MRSGAAAGHSGYFHETAFYSSDAELLGVVVPFLQDGIDAGEPVVVAFGPHNEKSLRAAMDTSKLTVVRADEQYLRPAVAIRKYRELLAEYTAGGAQQIRVVGDVPHPGVGEPWDWWARYEAAINHAYDDFPVWGLCPYDTRTAPEAVLEDVRRTHPRVATADGRHLHNDRYEDPAGFLPPWRDAPRPEPEPGRPFAELTDPTAALARRVTHEALVDTRLDPAHAEDFVMAVSEVVTNAFVHGRPPVVLRLWRGPGRAVATVTDRGAGPVDPFAGLTATTSTESAGLGLWIAHQVCRHVAMYTDDEGFVVRLVC